ncbi:MAG: ABC transporter substrate-binding protein [Clostridia bacterium]|nr:ABC transporter substrate-binding protein [Clostridia bacterium]
MKKFVRIMSVVLCVVLCAAVFAACGNKKSYTANNTEYFIGATGPLTGGAASYGISVQKGATLAVEEINKAGGLNGVNFKFEMRDDKAEAAEAGTGYDTLYEAGMQISLGSVTSGACKSFGAKAKEDNVFFMTPSASEQAVIEIGDNAFRVCFGDPDQGTLAAQQIKDDGFTNVGVIYDSSDSYSTGVYEAFKQKANEIGLTFTEQKFDAENKVDFSTQAGALKDCDIVFMPFYYTEAALFIKASAAKGSTAVFFGCDGFDGIAGQFTATDKPANTIKYITPFDVNSTDAKVSAFVTAFKAKYGEEPDQFAADGYDAVMAIYQAMKTAGVSDVTISASDLCNKAKATITSSSFSYTGATGSMKWDASGACTKSAQIVELD